ncbi:hypothetical protein FEM48_Zijuj02G0171100 [Ziziphus jujuba var. spinosa]|uniref:RRM domain-containing protein n=1 Tax=Ziziphus jujuba var. spinosa TaxID=714518 RepID=A0A978VWW8_ZIZJJ|nr:hypothetical protein FEM48_Zijuj02G0171100 [Ziziphus jujuba var. spinosa]
MATPPSSGPPSSSASSSQFTYSNGSSYFPLPFHLQQSPAVSQYPAPYAAAPPSVQPVPIPAPPVVYPASAPVAGVYTLPQYQQAQQLFQRDAQTITPEALESVKAALANSEIEHKAEAKKKAVPRKAAGQSWEDPTLAEWPEILKDEVGMKRVEDNLLAKWNSLLSSCSAIYDYRLFCGDLGNEVNDDVLSKAFSRFPSFNMARVNCYLKCTEQLMFCVFKGYASKVHRTGLDLFSLSPSLNAVHSKVVRDKRTGKTKGYGFVSFANPSDLAAALKEMNGKYVGNRPIKLRKSNWRERTDFEAVERQKNNTHKKPKLSKKSIFHK